MTLYLIAVAVVCYGLYWAVRRPDAERALTYPLGSYERWILKGGRPPNASIQANAV